MAVPDARVFKLGIFYIMCWLSSKILFAHFMPAKLVSIHGHQQVHSISHISEMDIENHLSHWKIIFYLSKPRHTHTAHHKVIACGVFFFLGLVSAVLV